MARKTAKAVPQPEPEMLTVYGDIAQETEDAILLICEGEQYWLPKSQIQYAGERGDEYVEVTLPDWLAEEKSLINHQGYIPPATVATPEPAQEGAEAATEPEPETVTLHGVLLSITETELSFRVRYGDEAGTETEFTIPREQVISLFDEDIACEQNELVLTVAYAVEAGIIEDPDFREVEEVSAVNQENEEDEREPGTSSVPNDRHYLASETITVTQRLAQAERAQYADEMATLDGEIEALEEERSFVMNSLKKKMDAKEEQRRQLSKIIREGEEEREIFCDKVADYNAGEIVWTDAHYPHDEVYRRKMTSAERQLPLEKKAKPDQTPPAQQEQAQAPEQPEAEALADAEAPESAGTDIDVEGVDFDAVADEAAGETLDDVSAAEAHHDSYTPAVDQAQTEQGAVQ